MAHNNSSPLPPAATSHQHISTIDPSPAADELSPTDPRPDTSAPSPQGSSAAVIVQNAYRSYRTRRQLADCAVMNQRYAWWNVLEGVILRQTSQTFYAYESENTAAKRWSRLKKKAAKVGKGLSKDENARKLAIQHWLEAIDPRHRYGHNLKFYYDEWERAGTNQPFFYWLDIGDGKDVDLPVCQRSKLLKEQIRYLSPKERKNYEVIVDKGKLRFNKSKELVNTSKTDKWIFVMDTSGKLYVGQKKKGSFQHSSFLAGGATKAAGRLIVNEGTLELMEAHSGHYLPTEENFSHLVKVLEQLGTDLSMVTVQTVSDDMLLKSKSYGDELIGPSGESEGNPLQDCVIEGAAEDEADYIHEFKSNVSDLKTDIGSKNDLSPILADKVFSWCSEAGARLASLADAPCEVVTKVH